MATKSDLRVETQGMDAPRAWRDDLPGVHAPAKGGDLMRPSFRQQLAEEYGRIVAEDTRRERETNSVRECEAQKVAMGDSLRRIDARIYVCEVGVVLLLAVVVIWGLLK